MDFMNDPGVALYVAAIVAVVVWAGIWIYLWRIDVQARALRKYLDERPLNDEPKRPETRRPERVARDEHKEITHG